MHHILTADQFSTKQIDEIFLLADKFKKQLTTLRGRKQLAATHQGRQMATLFYQPSTRTRTSFEAAALKLGIGVISTPDALAVSSAFKGETLEDTIKVLNNYHLDAIVIRYNEVGGADRAAAVSSVPIINGGDGPGEHPTQALLDAYTIKNHHGRLNNLKIVFGGDLKNSRTVRSLAKLLSKYKNNKMIFVSIPKLQIGNDVKSLLKKTKTSYSQTDDVVGSLKDSDIVYWTRLQQEYLKDSKAPKTAGFVINRKILKHMPQKAMIMHPLPRIVEIHTEVDKDPRAKYFEQAGNGLYIRMALLDRILRSS